MCLPWFPSGSEWIISSADQHDPIAELLAERPEAIAAAKRGEHAALILAELSID